MDLGTEVKRLRLDLDAVTVSTCLREAGVPHAVIKGPTVATWLYDPPRDYNDIDVLVPYSSVSTVVAALGLAGVAAPAGGDVGEEAQHSYFMRTATGYELDVHVSLPCCPAFDDSTWSALASHVVDLPLDVGTIRALDETGRCLVVALHALASDGDLVRRVEDLRRAVSVADAASWAAARAVADTIGVRDLFDGGLARLAAEPPTPASMSRRAWLLFSGAPAGRLALERLRTAPLRRLPRLIRRELFPTRGFMRTAYPDYPDTLWGLARAYAVRLRGILRGLWA